MFEGEGERSGEFHSGSSFVIKTRLRRLHLPIYQILAPTSPSSCKNRIFTSAEKTFRSENSALFAVPFLLVTFSAILISGSQDFYPGVLLTPNTIRLVSDQYTFSPFLFLRRAS